jgi:hypothetical protein
MCEYPEQVVLFGCGTCLFGGGKVAEEAEAAGKNVIAGIAEERRSAEIACDE